MDNGKNPNWIYNLFMQKNRFLYRLFKEETSEIPFFIFLTVVLMMIYALAVATSPELRAPLRLAPFTLLMVAHIGLYWSVGLWSKNPPRILLYLVLQGALAFVMVMIGRHLALTLGLFMGLVGVTAGLLKLTPLSIGVMTFYMLLSLIGYGMQGNWADLSWWFIAAAPMTTFVVIYVVLYGRQGEARARAQALANDLEKANRRLAEYATRVEELTLVNERQRMARELHDTLSQGLAGLILQLEAADAHLANDRAGRARDIVEQAMLQARETLADARRAISDLRQATPEAQNLENALRQEAARFTASTGIACHLEADLPATLPAAVCEVVERSAAEGLANVARHARASRCDLRATFTDGWLELVIEDNGVGFDPAQGKAQAGHYGLLGMRERARLAGGSLDIRSSPGAGTTLLLRLPARVEEVSS